MPRICVLHPSQGLSSCELERIVECFYDIPLNDACKILNSSHPTVKKLSKQNVWPFNRLKRGSFSMTWREIADTRNQIIEELCPVKHNKMIVCLQKARRLGWLMARMHAKEPYDFDEVNTAYVASDSAMESEELSTQVVLVEDKKDADFCNEDSMFEGLGEFIESL